MGKSAISMAIFNSHVKLPEGSTTRLHLTAVLRDIQYASSHHAGRSPSGSCGKICCLGGSTYPSEKYMKKVGWDDVKFMGH